MVFKASVSPSICVAYTTLLLLEEFEYQLDIVFKNIVGLVDKGPIK